MFLKIVKCGAVRTLFAAREWKNFEKSRIAQESACCCLFKKCLVFFFQKDALFDFEDLRFDFKGVKLHWKTIQFVLKRVFNLARNLYVLSYFDKIKK